MTRIVAGAAKGRRLAVPPGDPPDQRPGPGGTVRQRGGHPRRHWPARQVADLYAGSGAVGLEALSRGAADVLLVEADRAAGRVIRRQHRDAGPARGAVAARTGSNGSWPAARGPAPPRDFVFADPPYATSAERGDAGA